MISQRNGQCRGCRQGFHAGDAIFYTKEEGAWHWDCWESQPQPLWMVDLAERLKYRRLAPAPAAPVATPEEQPCWEF